MPECHLPKCNAPSFIRQIVFGLVAGLLCFLVLSYADPSARKDEPEVGVVAPAPVDSTLPDAGPGQASGAAATLIRPVEAGFPLPGSEPGLIAEQTDGLAGKVVPMLNMPVSGALPSAAEVPVEPMLPMQMPDVPSASLPAAKPSASSESVSKPASEPVSKPAPEPESRGRVPGKLSLTPVSVLNQKNINHLSVQLMGASSLDAIEQFVLANRLADKVWVYRTRFHGSPWYVVLKGDHAGLSQALAAIRKLPPALQKAGPWPKSFAQVNRELKP